MNKISKYFLLILTISFFSCIQEDIDKLQDSNWEPEIALPLVNSRFGVDRLINKFDSTGLFTTDADDVIIMVYEGNLFELEANEIFKINDVAIPLAQIQNSGISNYPTGEYLIKSIDFDQCNLKIHIVDDVQEDVLVKLNMPRTTKNGNAFSESFVVRYNGSSKIIFDTIIDLSGYSLDLSGDGTEHNKLKINYTAKKLSDGTSEELSTFNVTFKDISFLFLDGYLGELNIGTHEDSIKLDVFKNFKSGRIILEDPKFNFDITNGFGMPIHVSFGNFSGNGKQGSSSLSGAAIDSGITVGSPNSSNDPPSKTKKQIDKSNSNVSQFLAISPNALKFDFNIKGNSNNDTTAYNFVSNKSKLIGNIKLNLPFKGSLDSVIIEDLYNFQGEELKNVKYATFKLTTYNSFPIGIYVQIYFVNNAGIILDSLIEDNDALFREAIADADGFSVEPVLEESYFTVGHDRFSQIRDNTESIKIRVMLNTHESSSKTIKITTTDYFDLKLGLRADLTF